MYVNNDINYLKYLKDKKIIIFGAGKQGQQILLKLHKSGMKIIAFCDNDIDKHNLTIRGIKVISFEDLLRINDIDTMIVISAYEKELKEQLLMNRVYNFISSSQIDFGGGEEYYDEQYFQWQQKAGIFGAKIKVNMFKPHINKDMTVVEFGSGGGICLNRLMQKKKLE